MQTVLACRNSQRKGIYGSKQLFCVLVLFLQLRVGLLCEFQSVLRCPDSAIVTTQPSAASTASTATVRVAWIATAIADQLVEFGEGGVNARQAVIQFVQGVIQLVLCVVQLFGSRVAKILYSVALTPGIGQVTTHAFSTSHGCIGATLGVQSEVQRALNWRAKITNLESNVRNSYIDLY